MATVMTGLAIGSRVLSGLGKIGSARRQDKAAEEGRRIAQENANSLRLENAETERVAMRDIAKIEGEARARQAAGGTALGNVNSTSVVDALIGENEKQFDWLQTAGESRATAVERGADYNKMIGEAQADASRWGAVSDFAGATGIASEFGVFDSWGGKTVSGSQPSWMLANTLNKSDPLKLTPTNFNVTGQR